MASGDPPGICLANLGVNNQITPAGLLPRDPSPLRLGRRRVDGARRRQSHGARCSRDAPPGPEIVWRAAGRGAPDLHDDDTAPAAARGLLARLTERAKRKRCILGVMGMMTGEPPNSWSCARSTRLSPPLERAERGTPIKASFARRISSANFTSKRSVATIFRSFTTKSDHVPSSHRLTRNGLRRASSAEPIKSDPTCAHHAVIQRAAAPRMGPPLVPWTLSPREEVRQRTPRCREWTRALRRRA